MPTPAEQAQFALDRILTGPLVQDALLLPSDMHQHTLRMAQQDLAALPVETLRLLSDPRVIERVTGPKTINLDPWDGLLDVLLALPDVPTSLVLAWTRPALDRHVPVLLQKSIGVLRVTRDAAAGPLLLQILERVVNEPDMSRAAWNGLAALPPPWPDRALAWIQRRGVPDVWVEVAPALEAHLETGVPAPATENLIAWWALVTEAGGPRGPVGMQRLRTLPWSGIGPYFDPSRPPPLPGAPAGTPGMGPESERAGFGMGWLACAPEDSCVRTPNELVVVGADPAAQARCALARRGFPAFRAGVEADLRSPVPFLEAKAKHCLMTAPTAEGPQAQRAYWERHFADYARMARGEIPPPTLGEMAEIGARLPSADTPEGRAILERVLRTDRPLVTWQSLLERAFDGLRGTGLELEFVRSRLADADPQEIGLGLHFAQYSRDPALLPDLEKAMARAPAGLQPGFRRALVWLYTVPNVDPTALAGFAHRFAGWVDEAEDVQAGALATGLLDLGDAGVRAFVERLGGPRQRVFLGALQTYGGLLPTELAEALADRLEPDLPPDLRHAILVVLWRGAPAASAPAIAAAKGRLEPSDRPAVDVVLEVVLHRAVVR